jgi:TRAP-type C4-dicarboxylate transport system permease large subunit
VLTTTRVTEYTTESLLALTDNRYIILLLTNILLLVVGCFLEPIASISILVPVLLPVIVKVGIDPVHFGVMMTLNLMNTRRSAWCCSCCRELPSCRLNEPR